MEVIDGRKLESVDYLAENRLNHYVANNQSTPKYFTGDHSLAIQICQLIVHEKEALGKLSHLQIMLLTTVVNKVIP